MNNISHIFTFLKFIHVEKMTWKFVQHIAICNYKFLLIYQPLPTTYSHSILLAMLRIWWLHPPTKGWDPPHKTDVLVMTLNHLTVRFYFWRMWITSSLPLLPGPLWVSSGLSIGQIDPFQNYFMSYIGWPSKTSIHPLCMDDGWQEKKQGDLRSWHASISNKYVPIRRVTWSYNCLPRIILSHMKLYNCVCKHLLISIR